MSNWGDKIQLKTKEIQFNGYTDTAWRLGLCGDREWRFDPRKKTKMELFAMSGAQSERKTMMAIAVTNLTDSTGQTQIQKLGGLKGEADGEIWSILFLIIFCIWLNLVVSRICSFIEPMHGNNKWVQPREMNKTDRELFQFFCCQSLSLRTKKENSRILVKNLPLEPPIRQ